MTDLKPITPLGAGAARIHTIGQVTISENPDRSMASLTTRKGKADAVRLVAKTALGLDLPGPGQSTISGDFTAWWTGPDQWMIDADHARYELLAPHIAQAIGPVASVTEQTDGWCRFDLTGSGSVALLERLCPADVQTMQPGQATRTLLHHLGCFVICSTAGFSVLGPRSSAGSLHHALIEAAHSVA